MDLVQNLNLSRQGVSAGLLQLAQSDPKWQRVKHIPPGGGGSGSSSAGRGGLGYGDVGIRYGDVGIQKGRASTAVTSVMLTNGALKDSTSSRFTSNRSAGGSESVHTGTTHIPAVVSAVSVSSLPVGLQHRFRSATATTTSGSSTATAGSNNNTTIAASTHTVQVALPTPPAAANTDYTANPYMAGHSHGRGRHLTQPAWMLSADSTTTAPPGTVSSPGATHSTQAPISTTTAAPPGTVSSLGATHSTKAPISTTTTTTASHQFIDAASAFPLHSSSSSSNSSGIEASAGRRSRFAPSSSSSSGSGSATTGINSTTTDNYSINTTTIITISSSNSSTPTDNDATSTNTTVLAPVRKRSRWDT